MRVLVCSSLLIVLPLIGRELPPREISPLGKSPVVHANGLFNVSPEPVLVAEVSARFRTSGEAAAVSSAGADELEPWAQVLLEDARAARQAARDLAFDATHDPFFEMINQGESSWVEFTFSKHPELITLIGVCDSDCEQLDLSLFDEANTLIVQDVEIDDLPVINFEVLQPSNFRVRVDMITCHRDPCGYLLQAFGKPSAPPEHPDLVRARQAMAEMREIATAWEAFAVDNNSYATDGRFRLDRNLGVKARIESVVTMLSGYIHGLPERDPWGTPYYVSWSKDESQYLIVSAGADGEFDNEVLRQDIAIQGRGEQAQLSADIIYKNGYFEQYPEEPALTPMQ